MVIFVIVNYYMQPQLEKNKTNEYLGIRVSYFEDSAENYSKVIQKTLKTIEFVSGRKC